MVMMSRRYFSAACLLLLFMLILLIGCAQKQKPITPTAVPNMSACDIASEYVIALSTGDNAKVTQLSPSYKNFPLSNQADITFRFGDPKGSLPLREVTVDACKIFSSEQEYQDIVSAPHNGTFADPPGSLGGVRDVVKQLYHVTGAEFLVLSTHEVQDSQTKRTAYVTVLDYGDGRKYVVPGIGGY